VKPQTDLNPPAHDARHLAALDALRGIAIILVITGHYLPDRVVGGTAGEILRPWAIGGVTLFFLLSGFLIGRNLSRGMSVIGYGLRRVFRIVPAYWVSIAILVALHRLLLGEAEFGNARDTLFNVLLLQDVGRTPYFNVAFWTLLIEAKFYVLAPFVVLGGVRLIVAAPYLVMATNGLVVAHSGAASNLLTYLVFCFVGMNFDLWYRKELSGGALTALVLCSAISIGV
jgi:peptidoglycan/LPS O-acetylase OafA/YrhL